MNINKIPQILAVILSSACSAEAALFFNSTDLAESEVFAMDSRFQAVGMVSILYQGTWRHTGSGTLIAPNWVLTAAHVNDILRDPRVEGIRFALGHDGLNPTQSATISSTYNHPTWTGDYLTTPDLGLCYIPDALTTIPPAVRFRGTDPVPNQSWYDPQYSMAGYGSYGLPNTTLVSDGLKRAGTNNVDAHGSRTGLFTSDYMTLDFYPVRTSYLEWQGTPGDSGGGWFYNVDGEWQLSAVSAFTGLPYNSESNYTAGLRVSLYNDWIDQTIASIPEPSSVALLGFASLAISAFRRRAT